MPRIKPVDPTATDPRTAATLQAVRKKLGTLPNIFTTFALSPAALHGYVQLNEALAGGRLTPRQREQIALTIAQENACNYCLSAHSAIGQSVGLNDDDIKRARHADASDAKEKHITQFALEVVRSRAAISDEALTDVKQSGLDDGLIVEIIAHVALNVLTNYLNKIASTEVDFPRVALQVA